MARSRFSSLAFSRRLSVRMAATAAAASPMATAATASAEQGVAAASAPQPGVAELHELQPRSAPFGTWEVAVYHPEIYEYSYQWNGKMVQQRMFRCMLVSTTKPHVYCVGEVRAGKARPRALEEALKKFTEGLIFRISKVALGKEGKKQYMHAPHKVVVDLGSTRAVPVLARPGAQLVPAPETTVAECAGFTMDQQFDITALIKDISEPRPGGMAQGRPRVVSDVTLVDGTGEKDGVAQPVAMAMIVTVFAHAPDGGSLFKMLRQAHAEGSAVTLFRVGGRGTEDQRYVFQSTRDFFAVLLRNPKAERLMEKATDHMAAPVDVLEQPEWRRTHETGVDYEATLGKETTCALLKHMLRVRDIPGLEDGESVWQLNWVRVEEPQLGATIRTTDGSRIWIKVTLRDFTGQLVGLYMREKAALALSGTQDADEFEAAFQNGDLWFPQIASVKIARRVRALGTPKTSEAALDSLSSGAAHGSGEVEEVDAIIVEAAAQELGEAPTQQSRALLPALNLCGPEVDRVFPAHLSSVEKSPQYSLVVRIGTVKHPCAQALGLVVSKQKTRMEQLGEGFRMVTEGVVDALSPEDPPFTLVAFCSLANSPSFRLDPPGSAKEQAALVLVTDRPSSSMFMVESVQLLGPSQKDATKAALQQLVTFAAESLDGQVRKRGAALGAWPECASPAAAAKCRRLGRSPTGPPLTQ